MNTTARITNRVQRELIAKQIISKDLIVIAKQFKANFEHKIGAKLFKVDSSLMARMTPYWEDTISFPKTTASELQGCTVEHSRNKRIYLSTAHRSLYIRANYWVKFGDHMDYNNKYSHTDGSYYEVSIYIGELEDDLQTLKSIKEDYSGLEKTINLKWGYIAKQLQRIAKLKEQGEQLKKSLPYFAY